MLNERRERLIDFTVIAGALLIGGLLVLQTLGASRDPAKARQAEVRLIEQAAILHEASRALPEETRQAIGLAPSDAAPGTVPRSPAVIALEEIEKQIVASSPSTEARLVWIALAVGWGEDSLARARIAELAADPAALSAHRATLDDLLQLANGRGANALDALDTALGSLGASRWLLAHVGARHLANLDDPGAQAAAADAVAIAESAVSRWTIVSGLEIFLLPTLGLVVLVLMPMFLRQRLAQRGLAADLTPSPFILERTWRVLCAWFVAFQVAGFVLMIAVATLAAGPTLIGVTMVLQSLAGIALAIAFIDLWARVPRDPRTVPTAIGLTRTARLKVILLWLVPGIALAMTLVRAADYLNLVILRRPPDLQSVVQLIVDQGSPGLMLLIGLGAVVLAPLAEELVFRGFVYRNLRDQHGKGLAMLLSGLAFAAVHFQPTLVLPLTALGVGLALLYEWSGSLWVPITVHALWNLFALLKIELWRI